MIRRKTSAGLRARREKKEEPEKPVRVTRRRRFPGREGT